MPAKSEFFAQPEGGVLGLRSNRAGAAGAGNRPSARARGVGGNGALRSARGNCENSNPNIGTGTGTNGRKSPRIGVCTGSNNNRSIYPQTGSRGGPLGDITNVTAGRASQADKAKPVKTFADISRRSFQPPATTLEVAVDEKVSADTQAEEAEASNAQNVDEYKADIYSEMFRKESTYMARADYLSMQTDITDKMRTILVDWLVEVHMKYRLRPETLHLTVNLIDRYLSKTPLTRKRLQLVGVAAMFIASKFEEINPPELHDWIYICDNAYSKTDLLKMECTMLTTLSFQITVPTSAFFFDVLERVNGCNAVGRETARYLLELGLLDMRMLQHRPSHVVSAALLLSNELLKCSTLWPEAMVEMSRYTEEELGTCVQQLRELLEQDRAKAGGQLQAIHKKFSSPQRHGVATMKF